MDDKPSVESTWIKKMCRNPACKKQVDGWRCSICRLTPFCSPGCYSVFGAIHFRVDHYHVETLLGIIQANIFTQAQLFGLKKNHLVARILNPLGTFMILMESDTPEHPAASDNIIAHYVDESKKIKDESARPSHVEICQWLYQPSQSLLVLITAALFGMFLSIFNKNTLQEMKQSDLLLLGSIPGFLRLDKLPHKSLFIANELVTKVEIRYGCCATPPKLVYRSILFKSKDVLKTAINAQEKQLGASIFTSESNDLNIDKVRPILYHIMNGNLPKSSTLYEYDDMGDCIIDGSQYAVLILKTASSHTFIVDLYKYLLGGSNSIILWEQNKDLIFTDPCGESYETVIHDLVGKQHESLNYVQNACQKFIRDIIGDADTLTTPHFKFMV